MAKPVSTTRCARLVALYDRSAIKHTLGVRLSYDESGRAVAEMPYQASLDNALGGTHGGIIATLLDTAGWFAAAAAYDTWIVTTDLHVQLLEPARGQSLRATGELVRAGERVATARMHVHASDGTLIAVGAGTFAVSTKGITDHPSPTFGKKNEEQVTGTGNPE